MKHPTRLSIEHKKLIAPIILGGLLSSLCLLMIWHNLYSPWPVLLTFMASLTAFYFGWLGSDMLIVKQNNNRINFPLGEKSKNLENFSHFFNQYQTGLKHKIIYHITSLASWEAQKEADAYSHDSMTAEGFIHASEDYQVPGVMERFFEGAKDLVILCVDALKLKSELKYETAHDADGLFPHIYGCINRDAVLEVLMVADAASFDPIAIANYQNSLYKP